MKKSRAASEHHSAFGLLISPVDLTKPHETLSHEELMILGKTLSGGLEMPTKKVLELLDVLEEM